uniref:SCP domain-containing protein n=1 Tax=Mesocestoides corti TaxID=53468 RepID=A0A5K3G0F6_MESCO
MWKLVFVLSLSMCALAEVPTEEDRQIIVEMHAKTRSSVNPTASSMQLMRYSNDLENLAEQWTANCFIRTPNSTLLPNHSDIAVTWIYNYGGKPEYSGTMSILSEPLGKYFYENNSCSGNCRLYLQFIWANTTAVGCAMNTCNITSKNKRELAYLVACAYKPAGNIPGLQPYENGTSCSACPDGFFCHRNQCTNDTSLLPNTTTSSTTTSTTTVAIGTSSSMTTTTSAANNTTTVAIGTSSSMTTTFSTDSDSQLKCPLGESWFSHFSYCSLRIISYQSIDSSPFNICLDFLMGL